MTTRVALQLHRSGFSLNVSLELPASGVTAILGPSGCGKTTLLRCIAGLEQAATGVVQVNDEVWQDSAQKIFIPTWKRSIGYVFQEASLFDHLKVRANLEYGLRRTKADSRLLEEAIHLLGIAHLLGRTPSALSGGERQRVAIARALATAPRLLLLDEPLAALDEARKGEVLPWLDRLRKQSGVPMLYVTHARSEALRLADTVVMMRAGAVVSQHADVHAALADRACEVVALNVAQNAVCLKVDGQVVWIRLPRHQSLPEVGQMLALQLQPVLAAQ
jgi:molybdate transport system ATP-binding protein